MYQSGYLESEIWQDGFVDPHVWYAEFVLPDITSGSYDGTGLTITANGEGFRSVRGTGVLYYRKDGGAWTAVLGYNSWSSVQIVATVPALGNGVYDLKVVTSLTDEDTLLSAFSVSPSVSTTYYTDADQVGTGTGVELDPWNLTQLKAYFNHDTGYWPVDGDIIYVKGDIAAAPTDAYIFLVNVGDSKTITVKAWGKSTNGMFTVTTTNSGLDIFRIAATNSDVRIIVNDMVILTTAVAGPSADPLIVVKSLDNSVASNRFEFKDGMIISEEDISMTGATEKTDIKIFGSNLSFGGTATFEIDEYSDTTLIYDTVVNLEDTASINATATPIWTNCETNGLAATLPGTKTGCTYSNSSIERMPTTLAVAAFYENDFNYGIYDITNAGSGSTFWTANDIALDIMGYARAGIGAFRFEANTYIVDGTKQIDGDGTSDDAFTMGQFRNYFDSSLGTACGVSPTGFDTFEMIGIFTPIDDFFMSIDNVIGGYITIKCNEILKNKAWFIETKECSSFDIFQFGSGAYVKKITVKDFILTENDTSISEVVTINSDGVSSEIELVVLDSSLYCGVSDIGFSTDDSNISLTGKGMTMKTPGIFSTASPGGDFLFSDSVVNAGSLYDEVSIPER